MSTDSLFTNTPIVPVVTIGDAENAIPLAESLLQAGIQAMEITLRTEAALDAIESVSKNVTGMIVGAGSLRETRHIQQAVDAGARFGVCPGFTHTLLECADSRKLPFIPGAATAAEVLQLSEIGYNLVKFFPAELSGGVKMIEAISQPLPEIRFFPTGGINPSNVRDYLDCPVITCVGGSWFVPADRIDARDFNWIENAARDAYVLAVS